MYKCTETFTQGIGIDQPAGHPNGITSAILSLPTIDSSIPVCYSDGIDEPVKKLARYLANSNVITLKDRKSKYSVTTTIARAMKREIDSQTGKMLKFKLDFSFSTSTSSPYSSFKEDNANDIAFSISHTGQVPFVNVKTAINKLNQVHPDLGQTIYAVLEMASIRSMGILTFSNCCGRFSNELAIANDEDEQEEFAEMEIEYRTTEDIDKLAESFDIPWINCAKPILTPYEVWHLSQQKKCPKWIRQCIESALEVAQAYEQETSPYGLGVAIDQDPIYSLGIVEFFEQDPTQQLMDDIAQEANNCYDSYTEYLHEEHISLQSEKEFLDRWKEISNGLKLLGKLDKLFSALEQ
jgi:PRTRC genetic system protein F